MELRPLDTTSSTNLHISNNVFQVMTTIALVKPASVLSRRDARSGERIYAIERYFFAHRAIIIWRGHVLTPSRFPQILCSISTTIFTSETHSLDQILARLASHAQSAFGLSISDRHRWGCALGARCEGIYQLFDHENCAFLLSASSQGGWGWKFYLAELQTSERGVWESITNVRVAS